MYIGFLDDFCIMYVELYLILKKKTQARPSSFVNFVLYYIYSAAFTRHVIFSIEILCFYVFSTLSLVLNKVNDPLLVVTIYIQI